MNKIKLLTNCCLLALAFTLLQSSSCKKDDDPVPQKTKTELITLGNWKFVKVESRTTPTGAWSDAGGLLQACEKDNINVIRTNATYEINEGATKCSAADPQIVESGTWAFQTNETELKQTPTGSSSSNVYGIEQLTETTLILTYSEAFLGTTYYFRATFGH